MPVSVSAGKGWNEAGLYRVYGISDDPANPEIITISHPGFEPFQAMPVKIGAYCDRHATLPAAMQEQKPTTSRFLDALETKHTQSRRQMADAISFLLPTGRR